MNDALRHLTEDEEREALFDLRRAARLTQSDVAREVGLSQAMISLYESGRVQLKDEDLRKIEAVINKAMREKSMGRLVKGNALLMSEAEMDEARGRCELTELFSRVERLEQKLAERDATINQLTATLSEHIARTEPGE